MKGLMEAAQKWAEEWGAILAEIHEGGGQIAREC